MGSMELLFRVVKTNSHDEVIATATNFIVASAAFDTAVSLWPREHIQLRQGARVIHKSQGDQQAQNSS
jgi:hypothetical protein